MKLFLLIIISFLILNSCQNSTKISVENKNEGKMKSKVKLKLVSKKFFPLDSNTAPKPRFIQKIINREGKRQLTFLNTYNNSIYFYNYDSSEFLKKISFDKDGPYGIEKPTGYYIESLDSIYVYNNRNSEVILTDSLGKLINKISLVGDIDFKKSPQDWYFKYPTYYTETVTPFIKIKNKLLLTGQFEGNINDTIIDKFKFTANIGLDLKKVEYIHNYPKELYGNNIVWGGSLLGEVFPELHPSGDKLIYSFPVTHDLYLMNIDSKKIEKFYAGSNKAGTINSLENKYRESNERIRSNFVRHDIYSAIIYDKFRKVYYRFLRKAIPNASLNTSWKKKKISVIMMDEKFNYLGETVIGIERRCHWQNSFITKEGLNIEYLNQDNIDEKNLLLKIYLPKNIN